MNRRVAIIGMGKVGTAVGYFLRQRGFKIKAICSRSHSSLDRAWPYTGGMATTNLTQAAKSASIVFITVSDDQIEKVCQELANEGGFAPSNIVFHVSGALSVKVLEGAKKYGAKVGSIHPMQSFASIEGAITNLPGSVFGVTCQKDLLPLAEEIVRALGGTLVEVKDKDKPMYHAGACVTSNYVVALIHYAQELYSSIGLSEELALKMLLPLVEGTLANIRTQGTIGALTGPISRGDVGTIEKHLEVLDKKLPDKSDLYRELGKYTTKIALKKGTINKEVQDSLLKIFQKGKAKE